MRYFISWLLVLCMILLSIPAVAENATQEYAIGGLIIKIPKEWEITQQDTAQINFKDSTGVDQLQITHMNFSDYASSESQLNVIEEADDSTIYDLILQSAGMESISISNIKDITLSCGLTARKFNIKNYGAGNNLKEYDCIIRNGQNIIIISVLCAYLIDSIATLNDILNSISFCTDSNISYEQTSDDVDWKSYSLQDFGITFEAPGDYLVLTKNMDENDPALAIANMTAEEVNEELMTDDIVIYVIAPDINSYITVSVSDLTYDDLNSMDDDALSDFCEQLGLSGDLSNNVYRNSNDTYIRWPNDESSIMYVTIKNNRYFLLGLGVVDGVLTDEIENQLRNIADHCTFSSNEVNEKVADTNLQTYTLNEGPFDVTIDNAKYNVVIRGDVANSPAAIGQSGSTIELIEAKLEAANTAMEIYPVGDTYPSSTGFNIRIKDKKYDGLDVRILTSSEIELLFNTMYASFSNPSDKEIIDINGITYLTFDWHDHKEKRYATIINGDMVYIWAENDYDVVSDDQKTELLNIVESVVYPDCIYA